MASPTTVSYYHITAFLSESEYDYIVFDNFTFGDACLTLVSVGDVIYELECNEVEVPAELLALDAGELIGFDG